MLLGVVEACVLFVLNEMKMDYSMIQKKNNMKSIFRLEEIRSYDSEEHWYRDASIGIVGHYSSLEKVMEQRIRERV